jgi:hypothetical protein
LGRLNHISDARLKVNVAPITNALARLDKIQGVSFEWNDFYDSLGAPHKRREVGLVAQEVEAVFPELVSDWGQEGYKGIDYNRFTAILIEAIKELSAANAWLAKRFTLFEQRHHMRQGQQQYERATTTTSHRSPN